MVLLVDSRNQWSSEPILTEPGFAQIMTMEERISMRLPPGFCEKAAQSAISDIKM
jgi:hypothetical protein